MPYQLWSHFSALWSCDSYGSRETGTHPRLLALAITLFLIAECGCTKHPDSNIRPTRITPKEASLYIVDDLLSTRFHSRSATLSNQLDIPTLYTFEGATCGCVDAKHCGKVLCRGDTLLIGAGEVEQIVLCSRLPYAEGFYSESAFFRSGDDPPQHVAMELWYGVVKRLRVSPGAVVFERDEGRGGFKGSFRVRFRSLHRGSHQLVVTERSELFYCQIKKESDGVEKRVSPICQLFYEDEWNVSVRINSDKNIDSTLPPYGEMPFVVFDDQGEQVAAMSLPYNASSVDM